MEAPSLDQAVDVRSLPYGTKVGPWRLKGGRGVGVYGAVYRAVRQGAEAAGDAALKMALHPRDPRFQREAELLRRTRHSSVPRLLDSGAWRHPNGFCYPYVVMECIEGEPLYRWAARRNPSQHTVLRLLAQAARALQATHEATEGAQEGLPCTEDPECRIRRRNRESVRVALEADAARRERQRHQQPEAPTRRVPRGEMRRRVLSGLLGLAAIVTGGVLSWSRDRQPVSADDEPRMTQRSAAEGQDGGVTYVGDTATTFSQSTVQSPSGRGIALEAPPKPLPGQLKPDGNGTCRKGLVALNGGCWLKVEVGDLENCRVVKSGVVFKQACYAPIFPTEREPTSDPVKPEGSGQ